MVEKTRHRKIPEIVSWSETVACKGANLCISYDSQNRRVYRKADEDQSGSQEIELYYVLDGNRVIEERVYSDEDLKRDYWYGVYIDEPVFGRCDINDDDDFSDTDEQFYYLHNTQYSVHAILDTSGSIIEVYKNYQPYGAVDIYTGDGGDSDWWDEDETTGSLSSNYYLFTGRRYDPEADLMFYRNRMYSTSRGRFLQRDPIGYVDGMNLYRAYFVPLGVDPKGLNWLVEWNPTGDLECDEWSDWEFSGTFPPGDVLSAINTVRIRCLYRRNRRCEQKGFYCYFGGTRCGCEYLSKWTETDQEWVSGHAIPDGTSHSISIECNVGELSE